jgi:hypothetical protein
MTLTASSQKYIDGWKIQNNDTLGCFSLAKIKTFATTKVNLQECDSMLATTEERIRILNNLKDSYIIENELLTHEQVIARDIITKYKLQEENIIQQNITLQEKVKKRGKIITFLSSIIGAGIITVIIIK